MEAQSNGSEKSQFALLRSRRFAPFFFTQLLGAFNDNLFKNALLLLVAFSVTFQQGMDANLIINLAAGLFILPFFLFSATAGQLADKYEKSAIIRWVKLAEIGVMGLGAWALIQGSVMALLAVLFFMGTQSAFFGPVKYAIIPQHLKEHELIGGNAQVEMGTFVAILLGTISAGVIMAGSDTSPILWVIGSILAVAVLGYFFSRWIPQAPASNPSLKIDWNPVRSTWKNLKMAGDNQAVFYSILGISWFWFLGSIYLTQLPNFTKEILHGAETVVTLLLTLFSVGIALGSLLCERLCGRKVELGLVPFGSIGLSLFGIDLYFSVEAANVAGLIDVPAFIQSGANLRLLFDLFMLGLFGGLYIVPLYAIVQSRTEEKNRARIISANNILNALFMVLA